MAEETILLNFEIDQGKAERDLIAINKAILNNKEAAQELQKAYKAGTITQDEYVEENIRLQQNLKKTQQQSQQLTKLVNTESNSRNALKARVSQLTNEYDNLNVKTAQGAKRADELQKELSQLNAEISKSSKSAGLFKDQIGNYPDAFKNAASSINVAGVSVVDIGTKLASFANPATAAVGIVTALGAAYARSTIGAKDLEFAQNTLAAAITISTNKFAEFISSTEDGEGVITRLTDLLVGSLFGISTLIDSKLAAFNLEKLEDLQREEIGLRDQINGRLETNQELLTQIQEEQTSFNDKIYSADLIVDNLRQNESELLDIKRRQLNIINDQLKIDKENETTQTQILEKQREISNIERDTEKRVQNILRLKSNINQAENKRIELEKKRESDFGDQATSFVAERDAAAKSRLEGPIKFNDDPDYKNQLDPAMFDTELRAKQEKEFNKVLIDLFGEREALYLGDVDKLRNAAELKKQVQEAELNVTEGILGSVASLFDEQSAQFKALATAQTLISTYSTAQKAYEAAFVPPTVASPALGALYAALAVAQGLANVANINGVQFADGGWTGPGNKYDAVGVVHADEYVTPKWQVNHPAAQPHINALESMRVRGYADGGYVANQATAEVSNSLMIANAFKNLPPVIASWTEGRAVGRKLSFKERVSSI